MRLIDADELITAFPCGETVRTECVRATIEHMSTIEERKKGKWINHGQYADFFPHCEYRCSECDQPYLEIEMTWNFCPNCGADMRGEKHEAN